MTSIFILQQLYSEGSEVHSVYRTLEEAKLAGQDLFPSIGFEIAIIEEYSLDDGMATESLWQLYKDGVGWEYSQNGTIYKIEEKESNDQES